MADDSRPGLDEPASPLLKLIMHAHPTSSVAESFRTVRANVARAMQNGAHTILVVSTWPNDGKSTVSANIAVALAQIRKNVILVDADLRRPTLTELFEETRHDGFANALESADYKVEKLLRNTSQERLRFLPSGPVPAHPSDLVGGARARIVIDELAKISDCVLLDSPPLSICSDAMVLAGLVDGIILIINPRLWQGERELQAKESLEEAGGKIIGAILNEVEERDVSYANYNYYGSDKRPSKPSRWTFWRGNSK